MTDASLFSAPRPGGVTRRVTQAPRDGRSGMTDLDVLVATQPARDASGSLPIDHYAMLSDCSSAALVGTDGSVDWLCLPRFDSSAVFSRLLDPEAGHWSIAPVDAYKVKRRYLPG